MNNLFQFLNEQTDDRLVLYAVFTLFALYAFKEIIEVIVKPFFKKKKDE